MLCKEGLFMINTAGIFVNTYKDSELELTARVVSALESLSVAPVFLQETAKHLGRGGKATVKEFVEASDCILVLGGDGTVLRIAAEAAREQKPIMCINLGRVGFLSELEPEELEAGLAKLAAGEYTIESRMMLQCRAAGENFLALNDICLQRASTERLIHMKLFAGHQPMDSFSADGVLVSSPTGSTAYSLSAGGPILHPLLSALLVTPICAHTLRARPLVLFSEETIHIRVENSACVSLMIDGEEAFTGLLREGLTVEKADCGALFIRLKNRNFYSRLHNKLNEWNIAEEDTPI